MDELIIRMHENDRITLVKLRKHRVNEFSKQLEKRILSYFNGLFERKTIPKAFKESHDRAMEQQEQVRENIAAATSHAQAMASSSPNTLLSSAALATSIATSVAETYQEHRMAQFNRHEADEQLKAERMDIYLSKDRPKIIKSVVNILASQHMLLIGVLNGGNEGYIKLANFMGDAIKAFSLDKLKEAPNQINCLVDAAIPKSNSAQYYTFSPSKTQPWLLKTLEICKETRQIINRCGPAVQALYGNDNGHNYYLLKDVINFPLIINARGEIIRSATEKENPHQRLDSQNPYPVILIGPNETTADIGLGHGTTPMTDNIQSHQLSALQRLVPKFFSKEINHDVAVNVDSSDEDPAEEVHPEERYEFEWTIERKQLWVNRQKEINDASKHLKPPSQASMEPNLYGQVRKKTANAFDAQQAIRDVHKMLNAANIVLNELNIARESDTQEETIAYQTAMKEKLATQIYYLILSVKQFVLAAQKLPPKDPMRKHHFNLAIKALKHAKHHMQAIRDTPISEHSAKKQHEKLTQEKKDTFKLWQEHLFYCNTALDITSHASVPLQHPQAIRKFVFDMDSKNSKKINELMNQAILHLAHTNLLMEQMSIINKYTSFDLTTNAFPSKKRPFKNRRQLMKISQVSKRFNNDRSETDLLFNLPLQNEKVLSELDDDLSQNEANRSSEIHNKKKLSIFSSRQSQKTSKTKPHYLGDISENAEEEKTDDENEIIIRPRLKQNKQSSGQALQVEMVQIGASISLNAAEIGGKEEGKDETSSHQASNTPQEVSSQEKPSLPEEFATMIKIAFHDLTVSKKNRIDSKLEKIRIFTDGIRRFKNGIFSSLGIDEFELKNNKAYSKGLEVSLAQDTREIAASAERLYKEALENRDTAYLNKKRAMMKLPLSRKKLLARNTLLNCEAKSIQQIHSIIDSLGTLESKFLNDESSASRVLSVFLRFQTIIRPTISLVKSNTRSEWNESVDKISDFALKHENSIDKKNFRNMEDAYEKMQRKLNELPPGKPSTLNGALTYAQIIKNCNRKVIHSANGERTVTASSDSLTKQLDEDINKIKFDIKKIKKSLINLTRDCQTSTDNSDVTKHNKVTLNTSAAIKEINDFIQQLDMPPKTPYSKTRLTRCDSSVAQENTVNDIKLQLFDYTNQLVEAASDIKTRHSLPMAESIALEKMQDKKDKLLIHVKHELKENMKLLNAHSGYLNWGVWIVSIVARTCALFHREQLDIASENIDYSLEAVAEPKEPLNKTDRIMLNTRNLILEVYQQLDHAMNSPMDEHEETLSSTKECVMDELQWASQLSIDEMQARDNRTKKKKALKNQTSQSIIPTLNTYQCLLKSSTAKLNPNKSIYYQLLIYSILFVRNKQNIIQKLHGYRSQLKKDNHYFKHMTQERMLHSSLLEDIQALYKSIDSRIHLEKNQKNNINILEKNLTSALVMKRIFFQDWKEKTRDPFPTNSLLSALKEASIVKEKHKKRLIDEKTQADNDKEEKEGGDDFVEGSIEDLTIENIKEQFVLLQLRIQKAKELKVNSQHSAIKDNPSESGSDNDYYNSDVNSCCSKELELKSSRHLQVQKKTPSASTFFPSPSDNAEKKSSRRRPKKQMKTERNKGEPSNQLAHR